MATIGGRITVAQESRFQLTDRHGVAHLFLLGPGCAAEPEQLAPLAGRQAEVWVTFEPADNVIARLATRIDLIDGPSS